MPITRTAWIDDDGSGTTGTVINNAEKTLLYNQIDAALGGTWVDVAFNAANYTATTGTWTVIAGNIATHAYMLIGKTLWVTLVASSTVVAGGPYGLKIPVPLGLTVARHNVSPINVFDGAAGSSVGYATTAVGATFITYQRDVVGTAWGAGSTHIHGTVILNVV